MKCKLVNSKKTQKFCRFLRLNDDVGFHLEEGRGDERYRYFGNGFKNLECGISIANPDENDKSPWKCFIGVDDENGEMKTIGGIVDGTDPKQTQSQGYLFFSFKFLVFHFLCIFFVPLWLINVENANYNFQTDDIETNDVYGLENTPVNILCKRSIRTDYCWFRDPSGQKISLSDQNPLHSTDKYRSENIVIRSIKEYILAHYEFEYIFQILRHWNQAR